MSSVVVLPDIFEGPPLKRPKEGNHDSPSQQGTPHVSSSSARMQEAEMTDNTVGEGDVPMTKHKLEFFSLENADLEDDLL